MSASPWPTPCNVASVACGQLPTTASTLCISRPIAWWDRHVVDGFFNFLAWSAEATSDEIRGLQSGRIQQYALVFLLGTLALILILI